MTRPRLVRIPRPRHALPKTHPTALGGGNARVDAEAANHGDISKSLPDHVDESVVFGIGTPRIEPEQLHVTPVLRIVIGTQRTARYVKLRKPKSPKNRGG